MQLLMGLNESYKTVGSNILMMTPLPNVRQAYSLFVQEEMQRQVTSEPTEIFSIALAVQKKTTYSKFAKDKSCEHCNKSGHTIDECRILKFHCKFCDRRRHTEDRCRQKNNSGRAVQVNQRNNRGYRLSANMTNVSQLNTKEQSPNSIPNFSSEQLQEIAQALFALNHRPSGNSDNNISVVGLFSIFALSINSTSSNPWILNSGATDHIVSKASVMTKPKAATISIINLPNEGTTHVSHTSNVSFNSDLKLNNVLCVPSFNLNLMSISKLTNDFKCYVTFILILMLCRT